MKTSVPEIQAYPPLKLKHDNPAEDPDYEPQRQCFGYSLSIIFAFLISIFAVLCGKTLLFGTNNHAKLLSACFIGFCGFMLYLLVMGLRYPEYLGGKPEPVKAWPIPVAWTFFTIAGVYNEPGKSAEIITMSIVVALIQYFVMFQDDSNPCCCCLCLKPWVYRKRSMPTAQP